MILYLILSHHRHLNPQKPTKNIQHSNGLRFNYTPAHQQKYLCIYGGLVDRLHDGPGGCPPCNHLCKSRSAAEKHELVFPAFKGGQKNRQMHWWKPETHCSGDTFQMQFLIQVQLNQLITLYYADVMALTRTVVKCWTRRGMQSCVGQ